MKSDLQELKLGARGRALHKARRVVAESAPTPGTALERAFEEFAPEPRRADDSHAALHATEWDAAKAAQEIAAQIKQIDVQRKTLTALLESLETN